MSETPFENEPDPTEDPVETPVDPEPTPEPVVETQAEAAELEYDRDQFDYSQFETDADVVTGTGEVTPDMRVQAWRAGYGIIRNTDDGWRVVRR